MSQLPEIPELRIVATDSLRPHEHVDRVRAEQLVRALQTEGFLKNPPVVLPLAEDPPGYVVLDGANRTTAFQHMGFPHMLVQIAQSDLEVESWNHAFLGGPAAPVLDSIGRLEGVRLREVDEVQASQSLKQRRSLAYLATPDQGIYELTTESSELGEQVERLGAIVAEFGGSFRAERTNAVSLNGLTQLYPDLACLAVYPRFAVEDVVEVVGAGRLFPSGITRFLISRRALRLNFPLAMLADRSPLESKERALEDWIRHRLDQRRVRFYAESTFLFDE